MGLLTVWGLGSVVLGFGVHRFGFFKLRVWGFWVWGLLDFGVWVLGVGVKCLGFLGVIVLGFRWLKAKKCVSTAWPQCLHWPPPLRQNLESRHPTTTLFGPQRYVEYQPFIGLGRLFYLLLEA